MADSFYNDNSSYKSLAQNLCTSKTIDNIVEDVLVNLTRFSKPS